MGANKLKHKESLCMIANKLKLIVGNWKRLRNKNNSLEYRSRNGKRQDLWAKEWAITYAARYLTTLLIVRLCWNEEKLCSAENKKEKKTRPGLDRFQYCFKNWSVKPGFILKTAKRMFWLLCHSKLKAAKINGRKNIDKLLKF